MERKYMYYFGIMSGLHNFYYILTTRCTGRLPTSHSDSTQSAQSYSKSDIIKGEGTCKEGSV